MPFDGFEFLGQLLKQQAEVRREEDNRQPEIRHVITDRSAHRRLTDRRLTADELRRLTDFDLVNRLRQGC